MKRILIEDAVGQALKGHIEEFGAVVLVFEGGYTVLKADIWDGEVELSLNVDMRLLDISHRNLITSGIITAEELKELTESDNKRFQEAREKEERETLARLKAKYENAPTDGQDR